MLTSCSAVNGLGKSLTTDPSGLEAPSRVALMIEEPGCKAVTT